MSLPSLDAALAASVGNPNRAHAIAAAAADYATVPKGDASSFILVDHKGSGGTPADGPLRGCVFSVKDNIDIAGTTTTCGSRVLEGAPSAGRDAWIVKALEAKGAQCIGKNNMHEFALGATGVNVRFGRTPNPYDATRHVGGSSGGSALAVALGEVHLAIGTDSGGSVRMPASFVGIAGYKPTPGALPMHGVAGASWSMDCLGLFTRTAADCAVIFDAIGPQDSEPAPKRLRFAYLQDQSMGGVDQPVWQAYLKAIDQLRTAGHDLTGVSLPGFDICPHVCVSVVYPEVTSAHYELLCSSADLYEPDIRALISLGELWSGRNYLDAQRIRTVLRHRMESIAGAFDAFLTPTVPIQPPRFGVTPAVEGEAPGSAVYPLMRFTVPFNVISYPGISVPSGLDSDGLPTGLQIVGKPRRDRALLAMAREIETTLGPMPAPRR